MDAYCLLRIPNLGILGIQPNIGFFSSPLCLPTSTAGISCHCVSLAYRGKLEAGWQRAEIGHTPALSADQRRRLIWMKITLLAVADAYCWPGRLFYSCWQIGMFTAISISASPGLDSKFFLPALSYSPLFLRGTFHFPPSHLGLITTFYNSERKTKVNFRLCTFFVLCLSLSLSHKH